MPSGAGYQQGGLVYSDCDIRAHVAIHKCPSKGSAARNHHKPVARIPKDNFQHQTQGGGMRSGEARDPESAGNLTSILAGTEFLAGQGGRSSR
jgi:hypothetical protein